MSNARAWKFAVRVASQIQTDISLGIARSHLHRASTSLITWPGGWSTWTQDQALTRKACCPPLAARARGARLHSAQVLADTGATGAAGRCG
jgi:hypothetical protein